MHSFENIFSHLRIHKSIIDTGRALLELISLTLNGKKTIFKKACIAFKEDYEASRGQTNQKDKGTSPKIVFILITKKAHLDVLFLFVLFLVFILYNIVYG